MALNREGRSRYFNYVKYCQRRNRSPVCETVWEQQQAKKGKDPNRPIEPRADRHPLRLARLRFARHRALARFRNIPFLFEFADWYQWWLDHGIDRNLIDHRDSTSSVYQKGSERLCMARLGDTGAYERSNVYLATHSENTSDRKLFS